MFKIINGDAPSYLQNLFSVRGSGYNLRNSEIKLNLPKPRTNYLKRSLCYSGALLWNSLPQNIRMLRSLPLFKNFLNYYNLVPRAFPFLSLGRREEALAPGGHMTFNTQI
jgi:hypothetical protein